METPSFAAHHEDDHGDDHADVRLHPPVTYLMALAIGAIAQWFFPLLLPGGLWVRIAGVLLLVVSVSLFRRCIGLFRQHATPLPPWKPSKALIQTGPYRISRNPIYLSLSLTLLAFALIFLNPWGLMTLLVVTLVIDRLVIAREEVYLLRAFGDTYAQYQRRVRRWL
ncbi:MAG: isoprenylcysteine carboxylmethyltransferase family protein [Vampirovibrionales bacterium]|nr:isoprenylcysteine carboxylmethyltransferase family protein [Vampirovibrionales bacterium]